jgi:histidine triad (HIT) family protein
LKNECIFCKIIQGDIPSYKLYEDEDVLVILDRFPRNAGECLVLTKKHYESLFDLDPALGPKIFDASLKTAEKVRLAFSPDGLNLLQNNGEAAGQQINHFHLHVMPRYETDNMMIQGKAVNLTEEEFEKILQKLQNAQ